MPQVRFRKRSNGWRLLIAKPLSKGGVHLPLAEFIEGLNQGSVADDLSPAEVADFTHSVRIIRRILASRNGGLVCFHTPRIRPKVPPDKKDQPMPTKPADKPQDTGPAPAKQGL